MPTPIARRWPTLLGVAVLLAVAVLPATAGSPSVVDAVPDDLPGELHRLSANLTTLAEAEDLETARDVHAHVETIAPGVVPHARDLVARDGALLTTLLDELDAALAGGNLSDARSLAQAASNTLEDEIAAAAERWARNRTAITPGPLGWSGERVVVPVLLVNPPPGGIGAFDVEVDANATPEAVNLATGRGETAVDPANGTSRLASFDAQALANLATPRGEQVLLGEVTFPAGSLAAGDQLRVHVTVHELADPNGRAVLTLGLERSARVPAPSQGASVLENGWVALGGVVLGAGALIALARRLEV